MKPNMASQQLDISADLTSGDPSRQTNALLAIIALISAGRDGTLYVSQVCQHILGNSNVPPGLRIKGYDILSATNPTDVDFSRISTAILNDIKIDGNPELHVAALRAMKQLPIHRLVALLSDEDSIKLMRAELDHESPVIRGAAAQSIAMAVNFDAVLRTLVDNSMLKKMVDNFIGRVTKMLVEKSGNLVVIACESLNSMLSSMSVRMGATPVAHNKAGVKEAKSQYSQAYIISEEICQDIVLCVGDMFAEIIARLRDLQTGAKVKVIPFLVSYLDSKKLIESQKRFGFFSGEILGHQFDEVVHFFSECTSSHDPSLVVEATKGLLSLVKIDKKSAVLQSQLPKAIQASIDSTSVMEGRYKHVAQQGLLSMFLSHMDALPLSQKAALFEKLPPMIAAVPSCRQRVKAFTKLWHSVIGYEWQSSPSINSFAAENTSIVKESEIQHILLERHLKDCVAGILGPVQQGSVELEGLDPPHARYRDPIFREEVVGSLLYVLNTHPRPVSGLSNSQLLGATSANSALVMASRIQAAGMALDWILSAKSALQNTKPCLGWDRVSGIVTTGTTACVDLWLQLLLRCINISTQLKAQLVALPSEENDDKNNEDNNDDEDFEESKISVNDSEEAHVPGIISSLKRQTSVLEGEFQGLLLQIAVNWRALHPVVRPRAVWLCACHLKLQSTLDTTWNALGDALRGLLLEGEQGGLSSPARHMASVADGRLRYNRLDGKSSEHEASVAAIAGESEEIGLLSLERLAGLVADNNTGPLRGKLSEIAGMLQNLAGMCMQRENVSPASSQRVERINRLLTPVTTSGPANQRSTEGVMKTSFSSSVQVDTMKEDSEKNPIVFELTECQSGSIAKQWASYPSTVPAAPSLMLTGVVRRYQDFVSDLQSAVLSVETPAASGSGVQGLDLDIGLPSLASVIDVFEKDQEYYAAGSGMRLSKKAWTQVSGLMSPISLSFSHDVDPQSSTIRLTCMIRNNTSQILSGIEVQILLGGPIAMHRRPLSYKFGGLGRGQCNEWEIPCRCMTFGWPLVQAFLILPVECQSMMTYQPGLIRCKPYTISPLELIIRSSRPIYPTEFFQLWQTFPNRAHAYAMPKEHGIQGAAKVLAAIEAAGLSCASKVIIPVSGGIHAAYFGISWSGHTIACIVSSVPLRLKGNSSDKTILHLHFGSDVAEVISPMRGHENDLVIQLTQGTATPVGAPSSTSNLEGETKSQHEETEEGHVPSTFSFFKSMISTQEGEEEEEEEEEKQRKRLQAEKNNTTESYILVDAAIDKWKLLRKSRLNL